MSLPSLGVSETSTQMDTQNQNISYPKISASVCKARGRKHQQLKEIGKVLEKPGNLAFTCSAFVLEPASLPVILQNVTVCLELW